MTTRLALSLALAACLGAAACGSPCQDLGDRICGCQPQGTPQDDCRSSVRNELGTSYGEASAADEKTCEALLTTCPDFQNHPEQCTALSTEAGKVACGLAYPNPTP